MPETLERATVTLSNRASKNFLHSDWKYITTAVPSEQRLGDFLLNNGVFGEMIMQNLGERIENGLAQEGDVQLIVYGGDGTLRSAVQELWKRELLHRVLIIYVPCGRCNVYQDMIGVPSKSLAQILESGGVEKPVDLLVGRVSTNGFGTSDEEVGIIGIGTSESWLLKYMEEEREMNGKLTTLEVFAASLSGIPHMKTQAVEIKTSKKGVIFQGSVYFYIVLNGDRLPYLRIGNDGITGGQATAVITRGPARTILGLLAACFRLPHNPFLETITAEDVHATFVSRQDMLHADAEVIERPYNSLAVTTVPNAVRFVRL